MKILLTTLNAKYIHSSLALRYLHASLLRADFNSLIVEFSINELHNQIIAQIHKHQPDVLCFSTYIWNIGQILDIAVDYKKIYPKTIIILGGPEVSFNSQEILEKYSCIDFIVCGEGEEVLNKLLFALETNDLDTLPSSITYRSKNELTAINEEHKLNYSLDKIASPYAYYTEDDFDNKIIYFESTRGCPFNCTYCLSSTIKGVRYFPIDWVKRELALLINKGAKIIKFIDRTFNCNENRAIEIMTFLLAYQGKARFHFEISAELLSNDMLDFLKTVPENVFDFEIGIQSTYKPTLNAINRKTNWDKLYHNINTLRNFTNIHIHLDLIAGLPYEDYDSFAQSFNMAYLIEADLLQLGFLKLLHGSHIRQEADLHGYKYQEKAPYQVLENNYISFSEMLHIIRIEDILDKYYNSSLSRISLQFIIKNIYQEDAFLFYDDFAQYWNTYNLFHFNHKKEALVTILKEYINYSHPEYSEQINDLLKYDYLINHKAHIMPYSIDVFNKEESSKLLQILTKDENFIESYLNNLRLKSPRELRKNMSIEYFKFHPIKYVFTETSTAIIFVYDPLTKKAFKMIDLSDYL